jgi:probable phosphomutase (TIGR03848 family)
MTLLLLIRHALTDATGRKLSGRSPGLHLNAAGRIQSEELVGRLDGLDLDAIYSSPLERCRETASPLATAHGLRVRRRSRLAEVEYGDWTNRSLRQLSKTKLWATVQGSPSTVRFPSGESLLEVQQRMIAEAGTLAGRHADSKIALFSHGDPLRLLLAHYLGVHIDLFQRLVVSPASVSAVALTSRGPHVLRMNDDGPIGRKLRG